MVFTIWYLHMVITFAKNISMNKSLTNIILIKGAFPLDRRKKKK